MLTNEMVAKARGVAGTGMRIRYYLQYRSCRKASCRCQNKPCHGPYWYGYWDDAMGIGRAVYLGKEKDQNV